MVDVKWSMYQKQFGMVEDQEVQEVLNEEVFNRR